MYYILLDTPFNPSVLEPGTTYGNEVRGKYSQTLVRVMKDSDWLDFVSQISDGQQTMVEDFQEYLLDKLIIDGVVTGTVMSE